jgi:DNA-3-methyladenine glycosylase II
MMVRTPAAVIAILLSSEGAAGRGEPVWCGHLHLCKDRREEAGSMWRAAATMNGTFDFVMTDHAAWLPADAGRQRVFVTPGGGRWLAMAYEGMVALHPLAPAAAKPVLDVFTMPDGPLTEAPELATALRELGSTARFRNSDLWDALGMAIMRQVIRAAQSKKLYRDFCQAHGTQVRLPDGGIYCLFPTPEIVLQLTDHQFASLGLAFKRRPLRLAAEAYSVHGAQWQELSPTTLVDALQVIPRVGPWTARAAVADWSNDWALYPYDDLAVRTWAKRAAPSRDWPVDEPTFGRMWRALAGEGLSSLTLLTLAWGSQHGDIG